MALLEVKKLTVSYGPLKAVREIDLQVEAGQIVALLGANGAGKSSTLKAICGAVPLSGGSIQIQGQPLAGSPHEIVRQGIALSPEGRQIFSGLSVEDNLKAGAYSLKDKNQARQNLERVLEMFPVLRERQKQQAGTLSGGEQQMLAIGRSLMSSPKLLLLDEPSLGLAPLIIESIFRSLKQIRQEGTTILIVEQNALMTLEIADYAYVLELGQVSMQGPASSLIREESLIDAYLGGKRTAREQSE
ncbi:MAG: ABC transporter ATP-binding protein [Lachnospiraceae bacterium]|nr:ABC transporter ATP-binding protein [Lachnospiraceae bacterium]